MSDDAELERLLGIAAPVIDQILARQFRLPRHDVDDIRATVHLRLVHKLRRIQESPEAIQDFDKYVARLTYNAINDHLRQRFPERTRLKNRLRWVLRHDPRLALWSAPAGLLAGLRKWNGSTDVTTPREPRTTLDRERPADALAALFAATGKPVELEALVDFLVGHWQIVDAEHGDAAEMIDLREALPVQMERREFLRALWREIQELRPMQRKALLLNLRHEETANALGLLVVTGIAPLAKLAATLEMSEQELTDIWNDLPLNDLRIAALMGITRQQVINLRKSARERLARRLFR